MDHPAESFGQILQECRKKDGREPDEFVEWMNFHIETILKKPRLQINVPALERIEEKGEAPSSALVDAAVTFFKKSEFISPDRVDALRESGYAAIRAAEQAAQDVALLAIEKEMGEAMDPRRATLPLKRNQVRPAPEGFEGLAADLASFFPKSRFRDLPGMSIASSTRGYGKRIKASTLQHIVDGTPAVRMSDYEAVTLREFLVQKKVITEDGERIAGVTVGTSKFDNAMESYRRAINSMLRLSPDGEMSVG